MRRQLKIALACCALVAALVLTCLSGWACHEYAVGRDPFSMASAALATTREAVAGAGMQEKPASRPAEEGDADGNDDADPGHEPSADDDGSLPDAADVPPDAAPATEDVGTDERRDASAQAWQEPPAATAESGPEGEDPDTCEVSVLIDASACGGTTQSCRVSLPEGASAYDALLATGAGINARPTAFGIYVAAIDGIAEKEHGAMSGWVYAVNGSEPNMAASSCLLADGDALVWTYVNVEA